MARKKEDLTFEKPKEKEVKPNVDLLSEVIEDAFGLGYDEKIRLSKIKKLTEITIETDKIRTK